MTLPTLHIFIIHTESLTQRAVRLHGTIQTLRTLAQNAGYVVKPFFVLTPNPSDLAPKQDQYQGKINYDPTDIPELDGQRKVLSLEILSNFEKHLKAWTMISDTVTAPADLFLVVEDDICMLPVNNANYIELLKLLSALDTDTEVPWDLLFTGMASSAASATSGIGIEKTRDHMKLISNKSAYFIKPAMAKRMLSDLPTTIKFSMRGQLSWYMHLHQDAAFCNTTKPIMLDGSKLGLTPTTLHESNYLIYNAEFIEFVRYLNMSPTEIQVQIEKIKKLYASIEHLKSPYITHIYAMVLHKGGLYEKLPGLMNTAIETLQAQQGLLNSRTEMLNHFIDMCKDLQPDMSVLNAKSKYRGMASAE
jgi:hypothetical protein